jgi:hypothetical protein
VDETKSWVLKVATEELFETPTTEAASNKVHSILASRPEGFRWAIAEMDADDDGGAIAHALIKGTATAVSDGSFKNQQDTSAFIIEGASGEGWLAGVNVGACRSELGGVAGIVEALSGICEARGVTEGHVEVGLDGEQAMKEAFGRWPLDPSCPDCDMLQRTRAMIKHSPVTFSW